MKMGMKLEDNKTEFFSIKIKQDSITITDVIIIPASFDLVK
jgi:hypothetical protein